MFLWIPIAETTAPSRFIKRANPKEWKNYQRTYGIQAENEEDKN